MSSRVKVVVALLGVSVVVLIGAMAWSFADGGGTTKVASATPETQRRTAKAAKRERVEAKIKRLAKAKAKRRHRASLARANKKSFSIDGSPASPSETAAGQTAAPGAPSAAHASSSSFAALENEISGTIGVAYAALGSTESQTLGPLQVGHAWSSFKVPITVTVMNEQGGHLTAGQEVLAASAITASDNTAAAALFSELENMTGGRASAAVEQTLSAAGAPTEVATAPPPPGAVSSWGQTEWELSASTRFYNALACGAYGGATATVLTDMENVIPEQQWGLGQAPFPSGASVAFKAGWGPDGSESGPYLVRQAGIIRSNSGGAVVTIAAQDSSGSFEAGVSDLDRVADWVAQNVPLSGAC